MLHHTLPEINKQVQVKMSAFGPDARVIGTITTVVEVNYSKSTRSERVVL